MLKKITGFIFVFTAINWAIFVFLEFLRHHPLYYKSFVGFDYYALLFYIPLLIILYLSFFTKANWDDFIFAKPKLNGIILFVSSFFLSAILIYIYGNHVNLFETQGVIPSIFNFQMNYLILVGGIYFLSFVSYLIGEFFLQFIKIPSDGLKKYLYSILIGIFGLVTLSVFLGLFGVLRAYVLWPLLILIIGVRYKIAIEFVKKTLIENFISTDKIGLKNILLVSVLIFIATFFLMSLIRPFPIGWDDMGVYMNIANQIGKTGALVSGNNAYNWSLFMSLGFVLFNNTQIALGLSWLGGFLSLLALFSYSRNFLSVDKSLLVSVIFYTIPSIMFLSMSDMKVDLGLLFASLTILSIFTDWIQSKNPIVSNISKNDVKIFILIGLLLGFAFGIKYTTFIFIFAIFGALYGLFLGYIGVILIVAISLLGIFQMELYRFSSPDLFDSSTILIIKIISLILILVSIGYIYFKKIDKIALLHIFKLSIIIGIATFIGFSPWVIKNYSETKLLSTSGLLYGHMNTPVFDPTVVESEYLQLNQIPSSGTGDTISSTGTTLSKDLNFPASAQKEEITRYLGYEEGSLRYITLPYDLVINPNIKNFIVDFGYFLILIFPLALLGMLWKKNPYLATLVLIVSFVLLILIPFIGVVGSAGCKEGTMHYDCFAKSIAVYNNDANILVVAYYFFFHLLSFVAIPLYNFLGSIAGIWTIFIAGIITILPFTFLSKVYKSNFKLFVLCIFLLIQMFLWMILGSGIYWYGMVGFVLIIPLSLILLLNNDQQSTYDKVLNKTLWVFIILWCIIGFFTIFSITVKDPKKPFNSQYMRYAIGEYTWIDSLSKVSPAYPHAIEVINADDGKVYRIGTFISYFINNNQSRIFSDNQLSMFQSFYNKSKSKEEIASKLQIAGFKYLVVDLKTATIDDTKEKTLEKKYAGLEDFMSNNPKLRLISTDRIISDPINGNFQIKDINGETFRGKYGFDGMILQEGGIAIFEII